MELTVNDLEPTSELMDECERKNEATLESVSIDKCDATSDVEEAKLETHHLRSEGDCFESLYCNVKFLFLHVHLF